MAVPPDTDVYLETVETAKDPEEKADRLGLTRVGSLRGSIQQEILLENVKHRCGQKSINKRKTDKLGLL